jgi:hypothetical protein
MRQLNKLQSAVYVVGAILMVLGAALSITQWPWFPYLYFIGAVCYTSMQLLQRYDGPNVTLRRLRRLMIFSDILLLVSGVMMLAGLGNTLGLSQITYLQYVYNKWVITLLIAAMMQMYVVHRIDHELEKEAKKL